jgi:probable rRNA maturation factor
MSVTVTNLAGEQLPAQLTGQLTGMARLLLREYNLEHGEVGIILAGDALLQQLNRDYRAVDSPTDVLAFGMLEPAEPAQAARDAGERELLVGDVYISLDRAGEQAREAGHHLHREILLLAAHGLLHLLGFDHSSEAAQAAMRQKEAEILGSVE